ncbi:MAG: response regulator [Nitrospirota bacterium]
MDKDTVILLAEDDEGHARLIMKNLRRAGLDNRILLFKDGQETLDFLLGTGEGHHRDSTSSYLLLLDISMPKINGIEVLQKIKQDDELKKTPVIMITTTDDPHEVARCHKLGCSKYIIKSDDYEKFVDAVNELGTFSC